MYSIQKDVTYVKPISNFPEKKTKTKKKQVNKNKFCFVREHFPVKDHSIQKPVNRLASQIK